MMSYLYLLAGIVLLLFGGDFLVKASIDLALRLKVSMLVIGLTVVSFATSAPELLVSLDAALKGHSDISFGNIIGSNIANIALILGLTAIVFPLTVQEKTYKRDWWIMIATTFLLLAIVYFDQRLTFWEAFLLVVLLIAYNFYQIMASRKSEKTIEEEEEVKPKRKLIVSLLILLAGVAGLKFGSDYLILGAVDLSRQWGMSERVIGLTVVSIGTSLPELAASLVAAFKGKPDLSVGNLIGSNIFNILAVLGITGMIVDLPVKSESLLNFDFPWLIGISLLLYPMMKWISKRKIGRGEGICLFFIYLTYVIWVIV